MIDSKISIITCFNNDMDINIQRTMVTQEDIERAEQVLRDNGIEEDEADIVLQAIGYTLLDTELYPD